MRLFGTERMQKMMETLKIDEDTPIDAKILSNAIENAQKQVESKNFQARKNTLEYDDVMNVQREIIYKQRRQVLDGGEHGFPHPQHAPPVDRGVRPRPPGRAQAPHRRELAAGHRALPGPLLWSSSSTPMRSWPPRAPMP